MEFTLQVAIAAVLTALAAYLLGSISFAIIITRLFSGKDIRDSGSGNAGMTNVLRTLGKLPAALTLLGDFSKGILSVVLGKMFFTYIGKVPAEYVMVGAYLAGLCAILGHLFPLYFGFRGGKGILTSAGVILILDPLVFVGILLVFLIVALTTRIVSLGSISAAVSAPVFTYLLHSIQHRPALVDTLCILAIALLVIWMHRANIKRLLNGTENRFGSKKN